MNIYLFHGTGSTPESGWFPWLKRELVQRGHQVIVPAFPTPEGQTIAEWQAVLHRYPEPQSDSILVGHSAGATFALRVLERLKHSVQATFLVAGVTAPMGNDFDPILQDFLAQPFAWSKIRQNGGVMHVFHSSDDPYVPLAQAQTITEHTGATTHFATKAGHFNASSGYREFPDLLQLIGQLSK